MLWVTLILKYFERGQHYLWRQDFLPARHTRNARTHHLEHFGFAGETEVLEVVRSGVAGMARGEKVLAP